MPTKFTADADFNSHNALNVGGQTLVATTAAAAGSSQSDATALSGFLTLVTAANGVKGVKLELMTAGAVYGVYNFQLTQLLWVYPFSGNQIDNLATNAGVAIPPGLTWFYADSTATYWLTSLQYPCKAPAFTHATSPVGTPLNAIPNTINPVDTSGGTVAVKLPNPATTAYVIFQDATGNFSTNNFSVIQFSSEKIGGTAATFVVGAPLAYLRLDSDGTNWNLPVQLFNQSANVVFAGPSSGSAATPTFRALASADLPTPTRTTYTNTDHTLVAGDIGNQIKMSSSATHAVTFPQDSDLTVATGKSVTIVRDGAGAVTLTAGTGATVRGYSPTQGYITITAGATGLAIPGQGAVIVATKDAANTWLIAGAT
jgi:hypothetical protein